jgi:hypothetical protein
MNVGTFFYEKRGAEKSTRAGEIAQGRNAVLLIENEWLTALYPNKISSLDDCIKYSNLLKQPI